MLRLSLRMPAQIRSIQHQIILIRTLRTPLTTSIPIILCLTVIMMPTRFKPKQPPRVIFRVEELRVWALFAIVLTRLVDGQFLMKLS